MYYDIITRLSQELVVLSLAQPTLRCTNFIKYAFGEGFTIGESSGHSEFKFIFPILKDSEIFRKFKVRVYVG